MHRDQCGTFYRLGIPAPTDCTELIYYPPQGWKLAHARQLSCGWWTIILERENTMSTITRFVCDHCGKIAAEGEKFLKITELEIEYDEKYVQSPVPTDLCGQECFHAFQAKILAAFFTPEPFFIEVEEVIHCSDVVVISPETGKHLRVARTPPDVPIGVASKKLEKGERLCVHADGSIEHVVTSMVIEEPHGK